MKKQGISVILLSLLLLPSLRNMAYEQMTNQDSVDFAVQDLPLQEARNQKSVELTKLKMIKEGESSKSVPSSALSK
jgi:hypothetical protein